MADEEKNDDGVVNDDAKTEPKKVEIPADADVSHTDGFRGLLADKQQETGRRQQLEQENVALKAAAVEKPKDPPEETGSDEDLMTRGDLNEAFEKLNANQAKQNEQMQKSHTNTKFKQSETNARVTLTAKEMGTGLDYDGVLSVGQENLTKGDWTNIKESADPAREAYETCIRRTPTLGKLKDSVRNTQLIADINTKSSSPKGGAGVISDPGDQSYEDLVGSDMSDNELLKLAQEKGE